MYLYSSIAYILHYFFFFCVIHTSHLVTRILTVLMHVVLQRPPNMFRSIATSSTHRFFASTAASAEKVWQVYLSGEIHSDWREVIAKGIESKQLPVQLVSPNTSHEDSDDCGAIILGMEEKRSNWDKIGAGM